ncbi:MAG: Na-translocating system protein MpsC family protein, partial [Firmicutes bacterium]|nr:Na-translocating system protein MpsC family protein [Bacillota bacterium]
MKVSTGELQDRISKALTQWEKEYLGRGSVLV